MPGQLLDSFAWGGRMVRRFLVIAAVFGVAAVTGAAVASTRGTHAQSGGTNIVLFTHGDPQHLDGMAAALASARRVSTHHALRDAAGPGTLIVVDQSAWDSVDETFLREWVAAGHPVMALNVGLSDLMAKGGFRDALAQRDARFAQIYDSAAREPATPSQLGFYSGIYVGRPDENGVWHNGSFQLYERDHLDAPTLRKYALLAGGLTSTPDGRIVPLSDLDRP